VRDGIRKVRLARESRARGKDVFAFKVPYRDASGKQTSETFSTMAEAKAFRDKQRSRKHDGLVFDFKAGKITFRSYAGGWLETKRIVRRGNTGRIYGDRLAHVLPIIGDRAIGGIRRSDIQAMVTAIAAKEGIGPATTRQIYDLVRSVFKSAVTDKAIPESPCVSIDLPELPENKAMPLTADEVVAIADAINVRYRALVLLAAATGLRQGECFGLTVDRIDFLRKTVTVNRQLAAGKLGPPKSRASYRDVPLPEFALTALAEQVRLYAREVDVETAEGGRDTLRLLFTSVTGLPLKANRLSPAWLAARKAAGLDGVNFHRLRHTYASLLIDQNVSPKKLQARLGHASITETMDTYGHLYPDDDTSVREVIESAFDDAMLTCSAPQQRLTRQEAKS
jgi:integrase